MRSTLVKWLFIVYLLGSGTLYSIVILLLYPFAGRQGHYWLAKQWCRALVAVMRWLPGITVSVEGLEHLPAEPSIILCRHESTWETLAFMAVFPRRISFVFKEELLRIPFFGWVLRGLDMVSLNRGSPRQAHQAVTQESAARLAKGDDVVIFPEGTRVAHDAPLRLTSGGIRLACATGAPAVPVVHNAGKVWPAKGWPDRRGHIRVVIGPAFSSQQMSQTELSHAVHDWMKDALNTL
ncbi:lysophospholipid acyltransferase family protein [Paraburkholderia sp.]|uniref:lysophospholipid acyltransferase family protein n=1 Tax=Paraburkholderia sp. TaxID=1926495 RepID=UPI0023A0645E|nr:lysophospholipid acyltransferase family protein [Paraburkholderia sp.]MDE1181581.1 lysophospholipid acyltransferase family protein [Paraburkholderia sp.]